MAQPPKYTRGKNFADDFGHETDHSALNAELDKTSNSINDIRANLAILQADDGRLRPDVVTYDSLDDQIVQDLSAAVRSDVQNELDRAEAAADRAEAIAAIIDIDEAEKIAEQVKKDAAAAASCAVSASADAFSASQSAALAAERAAIASEMLVKGICTGTGDALVFPGEVALKDQLVLQIRVPETNRTATPSIRIGGGIYPLRNSNGGALKPGSIRLEQQIVFHIDGYFAVDMMNATESHTGVARIATLDEIAAGVDDSTIITPGKPRQVITFGTTDITPGVTPLATGSLYLLYE